MLNIRYILPILAQKRLDKRFSLYQTYASNVVTLTGFEPVDAALRGLRLKPLVDRARYSMLPKPV